jgi:hypothetical protein
MATLTKLITPLFALLLVACGSQAEPERVSDLSRSDFIKQVEARGFTFSKGAKKRCGDPNQQVFRCMPVLTTASAWAVPRKGVSISEMFTLNGLPADSPRDTVIPANTIWLIGYKDAYLEQVASRD